jgi:hypothetical protein
MNVISNPLSPAAAQPLGPVPTTFALLSMYTALLVLLVRQGPPIQSVVLTLVSFEVCSCNFLVVITVAPELQN